MTAAKTREIKLSEDFSVTIKEAQANQFSEWLETVEAASDAPPRLEIKRLDMLAGEIRNFMLDVRKHDSDARPWDQRTEGEQHSIIQRYEAFGINLVSDLVEVLSKQDTCAIQATLGKVVNDGNVVKADLTVGVDYDDDYRHALFDAAKSKVLIVIADAKDYLGTEGRPKVQPDQGALEGMEPELPKVERAYLLYDMAKVDHMHLPLDTWQPGILGGTPGDIWQYEVIHPTDDKPYVLAAERPIEERDEEGNVIKVGDWEPPELVLSLHAVEAEVIAAKIIPGSLIATYDTEKESPEAEVIWEMTERDAAALEMAVGDVVGMANGLVENTNAGRLASISGDRTVIETTFEVKADAGNCWLWSKDNILLSTQWSRRGDTGITLADAIPDVVGDAIEDPTDCQVALFPAEPYPITRMRVAEVENTDTGALRYRAVNKLGTATEGRENDSTGDAGGEAGKARGESAAKPVS